MFPDSINTGITIVGKNTSIPAGMRIGGNCVVGPDLTESSFAGITDLGSGKTIGVQPL